MYYNLTTPRFQKRKQRTTRLSRHGACLTRKRTALTTSFCSTRKKTDTISRSLKKLPPRNMNTGSRTWFLSKPRRVVHLLLTSSCGLTSRSIRLLPAEDGEVVALIRPPGCTWSLLYLKRGGSGFLIPGSLKRL